MKQPIGHFIAGAFTTPGPRFEMRDPARNAVLEEFTQGRAAVVAAAADAARAAFPAGAALP